MHILSVGKSFFSQYISRDLYLNWDEKIFAVTSLIGIDIIYVIPFGKSFRTRNLAIKYLYSSKVMANEQNFY